MGSQDQRADDSYPEGWFPQLIRPRRDRERAQLMAQIEGIPTEKLAEMIKAVQEGSAQQQRATRVTQAGGGA